MGALVCSRPNAAFASPGRPFDSPVSLSLTRFDVRLPTQAQTPEGTRGWPFASTTLPPTTAHCTIAHTTLQSLCRQCPSLFRIDQSHVQKYHLTFQGVLPPSVWFGVNRPADSPIHRITVGAYNSHSPQVAFHSLRLCHMKTIRYQLMRVIN